MAEPSKVCHLYRDQAGEWRWKLVATNGRIVSDSGEGYVRRKDAENEAKDLFGTQVDYVIDSEGE